MNKLFIFIPSEGKQYFNYYYKQIFDFFKQKGLKNVNQNLYEPGKKDAKKDPRIKKDYKQYLSRLSQADLVVLESSIPDIEAGYLICKAIELNKPVIALCLEGHLSNFLTVIKDEKFNLVEYKENNIRKKLEIACEKAKQSEDKRFNFFVSSKQLNYLNQEAKKMGITKSAFIRRLIMEYSKKDNLSK